MFGDSSVPRRGRVFKEKDRLYDQSTSGLTSFSRNDNGEQKIHNVADATESTGPSEAQREHDDRGEVDHEECLKHTKKATHPERETKADDMMSTTFTHAACEGPCKQREVNRSGVERGTTLEELLEYVNEKIPEVRESNGK